MRPPIFEYDSYLFLPITKQAKQFLCGLGEAEWTQFTVAAQILVTTLETGRPPAGRSERVRDSISGLFELKLNPGAPGPQRRLLCVREGRRILCVRGLAKRQRRLPRREIELAERALCAYRRRAADERHQPDEKKRRGRGGGRR